MISIAVGTPYTRVGASEGYIQSLADMMAMAGTSIPYKVQAGSSYGKNRNKLVDWFMRETRKDWLLQLDDDIRFPATLPDRMVQVAKETQKLVVIASVPIGAGQPSNLFSHPACLAQDHVTPETFGGKLVGPINGFGGAVMLVARSVFEEMAQKFGYCSWYTMHQETLAIPNETVPVIRELEPDLSFARRLKAIHVQAYGVFGIPLTHCKPTELMYNVVGGEHEASGRKRADGSASKMREVRA